MTAPNVVQLKQAGDSLMFAVTRCELAKVGQYPELEIEGVDGDLPVLVKMPKASADRQVARLNTTYAGLVGKIVTVSRSPNKTDASKPYWDLTINGDAPKNGKPPVVQSSQGAEEHTRPVEGTELDAVLALHEKCFRHALRLALGAAGKGADLTLDGISALTAQAFIEASRRGVV